MTFVTELEKQSFSFNGLRRYESFPGEADRYDACTYSFHSLPVGMHTSGKIRVSFPKLENVEIFLNGGLSRTDAQTVVVKEPRVNASVTVAGDKTYDIDVSEKLFVTVLPKKNAASTNFEIEYQIVDAPELVWYKALYMKHFHGPDGFRTLIVFAVCLGCIVILLFICFGVCIHMACKNSGG